MDPSTTRLPNAECEVLVGRDHQAVDRRATAARATGGCGGGQRNRSDAPSGRTAGSAPVPSVTGGTSPLRSPSYRGWPHVPTVPGSIPGDVIAKYEMKARELGLVDA